MEQEASRTIAILIFPGFPMMAFSSVIEPLRAANLLSRRTCYSWMVVGAGEGPVSASNGVSITPDFAAKDAPPVGRLVVCSGGDADHVVAAEAVAWIRRNARRGADIGAVADAAFFLARAGFLAGYRCTLHWTSQAAFSEAFPEIHMERDLYVIDRKRFTSAGGVGSLDMMLDIILREEGAELAGQVAEWFLHSPLRSDVDRRRLPLRVRTGLRDELVLSAVSMMEEAEGEPLGMGELAQRLRVSADKLERRFRRELKISPLGYYRRLRLRRAADLLSHSTLPVRDIAIACGFSSMSSFARACREEHGRTPTALRQG